MSNSFLNSKQTISFANCSHLSHCPKHISNLTPSTQAKPCIGGVWMAAPTQGLSHQWHETCARLLTPFTIWIFVSVALRYGYYGDCRMVLGPSSSRLVKASSIFVEKVQVLDQDKKGVFLYSFSEKPELSSETNWSVSNYLVVESYSRKGFSLWLNRGSRISMSLEAPKSLVNQLEIAVVKGEQKYETLLPETTSNLEALALKEPTKCKQVEYAIMEDDKYRLEIINSNHKSIVFTYTLNVSSKMYDVTKAKNRCSTAKGLCRLRLSFPDTHYVILTTPDNDNLDGWYLEISFVARVASYVAILGFITIFILLILKYLGASDGHVTETERPVENHYVVVQQVTETRSLLSQKPIHQTYGTADHQEEEDDSGGSSSSSEDLYDAKLCVVCYDDQRNCFFVPCGHCATCYDCAQRIMEGDSRVCPICRRLIHKTRKLFNP